jgi:hypothetical protein
MKKLTIALMIILASSSLAWGFCNTYFLVDQYKPLYKNYKVCIYDSYGYGSIQMRVRSLSMCPYTVRYDDYNGRGC